MEKKYFFFDIDGTLIKESEQSPSAAVNDCINELRDNGHFVAIATGRPYYMALDCAREIEIENFVCEGGHSICLDYEIVETKAMPRKQCIELCLHAEDLGMDVLLMKDQTGRSYVRNEKTRTYFSKEKFDIIVDTTLDYRKVEEFYRIIIQIHQMDEHLLPHIDELGYLKGPLGGQQIIVEPTVKEKGINKVVEMLKGNPEDIVVFGDGKNDISMFKSAPFSIAMGNAVSELKEIASYITDSVDDDGIVSACRNFGWIG